MDSMEPNTSSTDPNAGPKLDASGLIGGLLDFSFNTFITIRIVKVLYILMLILIALGYLALVVGGFASGGFLGGIGVMVVGVLVVALEVILVRIWLELIVVLFRIGENTSIMAKRA